MTSYEPVVNLERLTRLFERYGIDSRSNFLYLTLPGSILDQFAAPRAYRRVPLQLDGRHTTSGRHSSPLTRGSLLPLALAGADLRKWIRATSLTDDEVMTAWRLAAFLHAAGLAGRDKVTLQLRRAWRGAALWTKQAVEESLGKSEALGIKIVIDEKPGAARYRAAGDPAQDRAFLVVRSPAMPAAEWGWRGRIEASGISGCDTADAIANAALRRTCRPFITWCSASRICAT